MKSQASTKEKSEPASKYRITVFSTLAQMIDTKIFTPLELDAYIKEILLEGYQHRASNQTTVYPAHTINKINVAEIE